MHQQVLCSALEKAINTAISLNIHGTEDLYALEQKTLTVYLAEFSFPLSFSVDNKGILVSTLTERSHCILRSSISSLIELQKEQNITQLIKSEQLDLSGDIKVAQKFAAFFERLTIDWEAEIATQIGDVPTYKLSQFSQWLKNKVQFASTQIQADASEWLVHEKKLVVTSSQLHYFNQQVTQMASDVETLEKRIAHLMEQTRNTSQIQEPS